LRADVEEQRSLASVADEPLERPVVGRSERAQLDDVPDQGAEDGEDDDQEGDCNPFHWASLGRGESGGSSMERSDWNTSTAVRAIRAVSW
jgi:hypothetical protein